VIGNIVFITAEVVYPATADASTAVIGGLPFTAVATNYQLVGSNKGTGTGLPVVAASTATIKFSSSTNYSSYLANSALTAVQFRMSGYYLK
jgi:hypothetical protein